MRQQPEVGEQGWSTPDGNVHKKPGNYIELRSKKVKLYDRLVTLDPSWESYYGLAQALCSVGRYPESIRDALEAGRRARIWVDPFSQIQPGWGIAERRDLPKEQYDLALQWEEARRRAYPNTDPAVYSVCLYRLGRYADALAALNRHEVKDFPAGYARAILAGASSYPHFLVAFADLANSLPEIREESFPDLRAMCHFQLGDRVRASRYLQLAVPRAMTPSMKSWRRLFPVLTLQQVGPGGPPSPSPNLYGSQEFLYSEAVELITGKPLPREVKP
jgi:tetratricopeptide (TPR) repeat protein